MSAVTSGGSRGESSSPRDVKVKKECSVRYRDEA